MPPVGFLSPSSQLFLKSHENEEVVSPISLSSPFDVKIRTGGPEKEIG